LSLSLGGTKRIDLTSLGWSLSPWLGISILTGWYPKKKKEGKKEEEQQKKKPITSVEWGSWNPQR